MKWKITLCPCCAKRTHGDKCFDCRDNVTMIARFKKWWSGRL